jgi:hypothetical protein
LQHHAPSYDSPGTFNEKAFQLSLLPTSNNEEAGLQIALFDQLGYCYCTVTLGLTGHTRNTHSSKEYTCE